MYTPSFEAIIPKMWNMLIFYVIMHWNDNVSNFGLNEN